MKANAFIREIRQQIARDELPAALEQLRNLLDNSPLLDEAIHQSGRFQDIRKQIRRGTISAADANLTQNQIRTGLLDLLQEIEAQQNALPRVRAEVEGFAVTITNSKNINTGTATAGRDIQFGDRNEHHHYYPGDLRIPRHLTPDPFIPEVFLGREQDLQTIHDKLFAPGGNLLLLVNGVGGVGKTSLAAKYYQTYADDYEHLAWVLSEKSIAGALLLLAAPLGLSFDERMDIAQRLQILLRALANLHKPCLLVIDNANELPDLEANHQLLRRLPNFHLLLTTRITQFGPAETHRIDGLPEDKALELFQKHYPQFQPDTEAALFRDIRTAVDGNTLVIELLAKNLALLNNRLKTRYALADLLADLQSKGVLQLSQTQQVHTDYQSRGAMRREKPEAIIAAMYDLGELPPEEAALLSVFAVLPAESIAYATLERLLPGTENLDTRLLALAQKGWIEYNEAAEAFKCSPVVQEVLKLKNADLAADCRLLIKALIKELDPEIIHVDNYQHSAGFVRYAETLTGVLSRNHDDLGILCQNIGNFHIDTGDLGKAMGAYQKMADIQSALFTQNPENADFKNGLAISYSKLGETHTALGNLDQALTFFEKYIELSKELYAAYPQNVSFKNGLAISYSKLGSTHTALGNLDQALTFFEERSRLGKELYAAYPQNVSFKNGLAISYEKLGETHTALGNLDQALTFFEKDIELSKELYAAYPQNVSFKNGLAISYSQLGRFCRDQKGDNETAKMHFEQCFKLWQELSTSYPAYVEFRNNLAWAKNALNSL